MGPTQGFNPALSLSAIGHRLTIARPLHRIEMRFSVQTILISLIWTYPAAFSLIQPTVTQMFFMFNLVPDFCFVLFLDACTTKKNIIMF